MTRNTLRYASDDHSGTARTISEIAAAHGLRAETARELGTAIREAGGYITVTDSTGRTLVHVPQ